MHSPPRSFSCPCFLCQRWRAQRAWDAGAASQNSSSAMPSETSGLPEIGYGLGARPLLAVLVALLLLLGAAVDTLVVLSVGTDIIQWSTRGATAEWVGTPPNILRRGF